MHKVEYSNDSDAPKENSIARTNITRQRAIVICRRTVEFLKYKDKRPTSTWTRHELERFLEDFVRVGFSNVHFNQLELVFGNQDAKVLSILRKRFKPGLITPKRNFIKVVNKLSTLSRLNIDRELLLYTVRSFGHPLPDTCTDKKLGKVLKDLSQQNLDYFYSKDPQGASVLFTIREASSCNNVRVQPLVKETKAKKRCKILRYVPKSERAEEHDETSQLDYSDVIKALFSEFAKNLVKL